MGIFKPVPKEGKGAGCGMAPWLLIKALWTLLAS